jgi:predicted permease
MGELFRRLNYLLHRRDRDRELEAEMLHHREMMGGDRKRDFGNITRLREDAREAWGWTWIERFIQDLSYAARILRRSPGFTLTAVLVLSIGIGVNITAFTLFNMVALEPLPVRDPASLIMLQRRSPTRIGGEMPYPHIDFYRQHSHTLSSVMSIMGIPPVTLDTDMQPAHLSFATANYFSELGTHPALGRLFDPALDDAFSGPPIAVLSYRFWQQRLNADPAVIGRVLHLNGKAVTVAGVLPDAFASLGADRAELWMPILQQPYLVQGSKLLSDPEADAVRMWARLAPGTTAKTAEQELLSLTNQLRLRDPKNVWENEFLLSFPAGHLQVMQPDMYQVVAMISVLTLLILAVTCANLGGLLLARGVTREHEIGIRIAIGASKQRILRQLLTESLLLASIGSFVGLALSIVVMRVTLTFTDAPAWLSATPDWRVFGFSFVIAVIAAVLFGFAPALQIAGQKHRKPIARQVLIAAQVTASCVLLIVAGLLVRAMHHTLYNSPGFGYQSVLSIDPQLAQHGYNRTAAGTYLAQMESRLRERPGVLSVALVKLPPMGHSVARIGTEIQGKHVDIFPNSVGPAYFQTMNIPFLLGRTFHPGEQHVTIVSESLANRIWHGDDPIGKPMPSDEPSSTPLDIVVGVVGNARVNALSDSDATEQYWPAQVDDMPQMSIVLKAVGTPSAMFPAIKSMSQSLDLRVFPDVRPLESLFQENVANVKRIAAAVSLVGLIAVLLAGVGIVGLVAYTASQRAKEIAIRLALGATRRQVLHAILSQFAWPVALGLIAGVFIAATTSSALRSTLYGVSNLDPTSYSAAALLLLLIMMIATVLPARRSLRLDIAKALHHDQ